MKPLAVFVAAMLPGCAAQQAALPVMPTTADVAQAVPDSQTRKMQEEWLAIQKLGGRNAAEGGPRTLPTQIPAPGPDEAAAPRPTPAAAPKRKL